MLVKKRRDESLDIVSPLKSKDHVKSSYYSKLAIPGIVNKKQVHHLMLTELLDELEATDSAKADPSLVSLFRVLFPIVGFQLREDGEKEPDRDGI